MYHLYMFPFNFNRNANCELCDAVHREYQGILFFFFFSYQKLQFHSSGVNVILFKPEGELCPNSVHGTLDVGYFPVMQSSKTFCKLVRLTGTEYIS